MDIEQIKQQIDCRQLVEEDLGEPKHRGRKSWQWRCPFHHEQKGYSLAVWANGWRCFGACQIGGDAIAWVQRSRGLSYVDACQLLGASNENRSLARRKYRPVLQTPASRATVVAQPPSTEWQTAVRKIVEEAEATLWGPEGERALAYLRQQRGLFCTTIREARLGYIPGHYRQWRKLYGLSIPCGITIPWVGDGAMWALKVRRAAGEVRYEQVAGGNLAGGLYWADNLLPSWPVLLVEGEFNCLVAWQEAMDLVCPVSLGSASTVLNPRWYAPLATASVLLACYDRDVAGKKGMANMNELTARAKAVRVPQGKDVNEFYLLHCTELSVVYNWLEETLQSEPR